TPMTQETMTTTITAPKRFTGEILFLDPRRVPHAIAELAAHDIEFKVNPDAVDPCGPTVFGEVTGTTELDENELWTWLERLVEKHDGDICELGLDDTTRIRRAVSEFTQALVKGPIDGFVMWTVVSDIDGVVHGPFSSRAEALAFAANAGASVFEVSMKRV